MTGNITRHDNELLTKSCADFGFDRFGRTKGKGLTNKD